MWTAFARGAAKTVVERAAELTVKEWGVKVAEGVATTAATESVRYGMRTGARAASDYWRNRAEDTNNQVQPPQR